jgi:2-polyprenyl-3-methyl-5-hydroxy-6-metoxy-1,4-benzoquinol methylase
MTEGYAGIEQLDSMKKAINYNSTLAKTVFQNARGKSLALDVGAGSGLYAQLLREMGMTIDCVEADPQLSKKIKQDGFTIFTSIQAVPNGTYDYIYSLNVLEHIEDF